MTMTTVREASRPSMPDPTELLIKEARQQTLRRRLHFVLALLIVLVAAIAIWRGSGGSRPSSHLPNRSSMPDRRSPPGSAKLSAFKVLGGQSLNQVVPFGPKILWVRTANEVKLTGGGQDIELSTNAGKTWTNVTPPGLTVDGGTHWINGFFALSPTRAWLVYGGVNGPQVLETTNDAGDHWSKLGVLPAEGCSLQFVTALDGTCTFTAAAAGSEANKIYRTHNGGESWKLVFTNIPQAMEAAAKVPPGSIPFGCDKTIQFTNATEGWALFWCASGGATIYGSTNGGADWNARSVTPPSPNPVGGGGFVGTPVFAGSIGAVAYGGGSYSAVYVTKDNGQSFHPVYPPGKRQSWSVDLLSPLQWRLTNGNQILATNNGGNSWFTLSSNTVLRDNTYKSGALTGGLVEFVNARDGWLTERQYGPDSSLLRTTDEGRIWRKVTVPGIGKR